MRYALINSGLVANVVEQDSTPTIPGTWVACVACGNAGPGWAYDGSAFTPPPMPPMPAAVPTVSRRQARRALRAAGLLDDIEAAINALPEPARSDALIDWQDATEFVRNWPLLITLAAALGLSDAQVDALFAAAAAL